jgi:protein tyrosine phosphatase
LNFNVFSSAGVGRTGTYIAVDIIRRLIDQSQKLSELMLDVMGIVYRLRQDRGKMVQTKVNFDSIYKNL